MSPGQMPADLGKPGCLVATSSTATAGTCPDTGRTQTKTPIPDQRASRPPRPWSTPGWPRQRRLRRRPAGRYAPP
jgi:hypothetical protein